MVTTQELPVEELEATANELVAPGKGILAADESANTIKSRFDAIGVESTEENRRDYRGMLFRTPGAGKFTSGVILFHETLFQEGADGTPLRKALQDQGIIFGIKVDEGLIDIGDAAPGEKMTKGLEGLETRLAEYKAMGARFAKLRTVFPIDGGIPSDEAIRINAKIQAQYALSCQKYGIVPIVEPEVLANGKHSIEQCEEVSRRVLAAVFEELIRFGVHLPGVLLKPSMITSGLDADNRAPAKEVARRTVELFRSVVPAAVPGIVFLSGGQPDNEATANLDAINRYAAEVGAPWELSFSFGRGLQGAPQKAWLGKPENVAAAQAAFLHRLKVSAAAREGQYDPSMEEEAA